MNDLIRRLATSQARGERQLSLVNELLTFRPVPYYRLRVPTMYGPAEMTRYGKSALEYRSWKNLRKRLVSVGFVVETSRGSQTVRLHFPEMDS